MSKLSAKDRRALIKKRTLHKRHSREELASLFDVSPITIWRDIKKIERDR